MTYVRFSPRRPIKSFQDLEDYQKLLAVSVAVAKRIEDKKGESSRGLSLINVALELPVKIARAHSVRFSDKTRAIAILEDVMLGINILIVYLEQYRDIDNVPVPELPVVEGGVTGSTTAAFNLGTGVAALPHEFFEEQINSLSTCRWKVMHLARSWEKFSQTTE